MATGLFNRDAFARRLAAQYQPLENPVADTLFPAGPAGPTPTAVPLAPLGPAGPAGTAGTAGRVSRVCPWLVALSVLGLGVAIGLLVWAAQKRRECARSKARSAR